MNIWNLFKSLRSVVFKLNHNGFKSLQNDAKEVPHVESEVDDNTHAAADEGH